MADVAKERTRREADGRPWPKAVCPVLSMPSREPDVASKAACDPKEANDEDPDRLAVVQRMTWAYLRSMLYADDPT